MVPTSLVGQGSVINVTIDARGTATPFPHFWDQGFGSGRAVLALRDGYRRDIRLLKKSAPFKYVRGHAIFHDEIGVYDEDEAGNPLYNFTYVDQIYDNLLAEGVRPVVELGFMPRKLALRPDVHPFWYKPIVSPPKDYVKWDGLIHAFAAHLIERYGIDEVASWYFEVWNEPNIDFWTGEPKLETYHELYDHTARALKNVSPRLRVGGPATAAAGWIDQFLRLTARAGSPLDFVSSHAYADDSVQNLFGNDEPVPVQERVCRAVWKVRRQIEASPYAGLPILWTEWSVPSFGDVLSARDTTYVATGLAEVIKQCDGANALMFYWTFSDIFEEFGVRKQPFDGGFGLIGSGGIKKPGVNGFELLGKLGDERLRVDGEGVLATRRTADGALVIAVWNLVNLDQAGTARNFSLRLTGVPAGTPARIHRLDAERGNSLAAYRAMGSPRYPTRRQIDALNAAATLPAPETFALTDSDLRIEVPVNGLTLLEVFPK